MNRTDITALRKPLTVAIGGGKGGIGKSVVSLNLALAMTQLGARVTLVDADLGSANLHTMLGIDHPPLTLQSLLDGRTDSLTHACIDTGYHNLTLVAGSVAVPGAANVHHANKLRLIRQIANMPAEVVVIDCGAGIHYNVVDFFAAADVHLLIASAQLVSLQNAYGFLKASVYRLLRARAQELGKTLVFEAASDLSEVETVPKLLDAISVRDAVLANALFGTLHDARFGLFGNQLIDHHEQNALLALSRMIADFLCLRVPVLGALMRRDRIHAAVSRRKPFVLGSNDPEARALMELGELLLSKRSLRPPEMQLDPHADFGGRSDPFDRAASNIAVPRIGSL